MSLKSVAIYCLFYILKVITILVDVILLLPFILIDKPWKKKTQIFSAQENANDIHSPWVRRVANSNQSFEGIQTISDLFENSCRFHYNRNSLGQRRVTREETDVGPRDKPIHKYSFDEYTWMTYGQLGLRVHAVANAFSSLNIVPGDTVLIYCETKLEWLLCCLSLLKIGAIIATLYPTLGEEGIVHGIVETEIKVIITSADLLPKLLNIKDKIRNVTTLVCIDSHNQSVSQEVIDQKDFVIIPFNNLEMFSKQNATTVTYRSLPEDTAVIMYTSGSTGIPKGVVITHSNLISAITSVSLFTQNDVSLDENDVYIAYLPLAHILEMTMEFALISCGAAIGYSSPHTLTDNSPSIISGTQGDAPNLRPTVMAFVPLILDRVKLGIIKKLEQRGLLAKLFTLFMIDRKTFWSRHKFSTPLTNKLICNKMRAALGGKIRLFLCGGAPLSSETHNFVRSSFNCPLLQGYGLTETCAVVTLTSGNDLKTGRVGSPYPEVKLKLVSWPEGQYSVTDLPNPRGEIVVSAGHVASKYYKQDALTSEVFVVENGTTWFYTGDIGEIHCDGVLKIIDRKKDLIKMDNGEYVALGKIEMVLRDFPLVENICVHGEPGTAFLIGLVQPYEPNFVAFVEALHHKTVEPRKAYSDPVVVNAFTVAIMQYGKSMKLSVSEIPTKYRLCTEEWTPENGLVTAALKVRRNNIENFYRKEIHELYTKSP